SLEATEVEGGLRVSGPIHWASNLFDDAVVVFCARVVDGAAQEEASDAVAAEPVAERTVIAVAALPTEGVTVNPGFELLGLNATASSSLTFDEVFIDRKSTRLNSSHVSISYAVFCLKKKK